MNDDVFTTTRDVIATIPAATDAAGDTLGEGVAVVAYRETTVTENGGEQYDVIGLEPASGRGDVSVTAAQVPQLVSALWRAREAAEQSPA